MKIRLAAVLVLLSFLAFNPNLISAQGTQSDCDFSDLASTAKYSKTGLETSDYQKVSMLIAITGSDKEKIGLGKELIQAKCELRLRLANLEPLPYKSPFDDHLTINFNLSNNVVFFRMMFVRAVLFEVKGMTYATSVSTWEYGSAWIHRGADNIKQVLDNGFDSFLNEYLKANAK